MKRILLFTWLGLSVSLLAFAQKKNEKPLPPVYQQKGAGLSYTPDSLGNRIPDFSYAGYRAGDEAIPQDIPIRIWVTPIEGDATEQLQAALDELAVLSPDKDGFRGVVLLSPGEYRVSGSLHIRQSGIVLRGSGVGEGGTRLIATGKDRRTLIRVQGVNDKQLGDTIRITDNYVPVNAFSAQVKPGHSLKVGDRIMVYRPSTPQWIVDLGTHIFGGGISYLGWKPGDYDLSWDRTIREINGNLVSWDAPITTALDEQYGGGSLIPYSWSGRISQVGVENLELISEYDWSNPKDEAHAWTGISLESVEDAWVRNIVFKHLAGSAVLLLETAKRVTVEDCKSLEPVSEIGGHRRNTFLTLGQQTLFQRLYSEEGFHDYAVGFCAPGPNAFVQCHAELPYGFSGPISSWASGVLYDVVNINGHALSYKNRTQDGQGAGWNAANSVFWQCTASRVDCEAPPTAQNWAFGIWSEFSGNGHWEDSNNHIRPRSLYYAQLQDRLGEAYTDRARLLPIGSEPSSSPTIEAAAELTRLAAEPLLTLSDWIDQQMAQSTIPTDPAGLKAFQPMKSQRTLQYTIPLELRLHQGWLVRNQVVQTGGRQGVTWWSGSLRPSYLKRTASPHLTRFVPGRTGTGFTDDIAEVVERMKQTGTTVLDHNYGLWYERRRDDHERIRRIDGEVWAPFYEQPFARSGEGTAYDGLSKYDLTRYNHWYWMRLKQFADAADQEGLVLFHQNYFQHNIIEAGAHWTDSPWRPANNVNNTGFPEPAPYAGDKRIFLAEQFYDIEHPVRRELHRAYIRQCLENFRGNNSVVQLISAEYTGPLHFVEFWLDVIAEWQAETGEDALVALSATKDVQDAILADPVRSKLVDIIDIRYWMYREDGSVYAPQGGQNLAPRQHARQVKPGKVSFESVYRAVEEYRSHNPGKAVIYSSDAYPQQAWAAFMGGGSLTSIPTMSNPAFLRSASNMLPWKDLNSEGQYVLADKDAGLIVYSTNEQIKLDLSAFPGSYKLYRVNTRTGEIKKEKKTIQGGQPVVLDSEAGRGTVVWLEKK
ncbi:DUF6298 domain-containing protein [Bacteroidales bacterium OttesenSCG-928-L03]|nr:DUF6298 domain-containing protein [Bacteroidales bacterium OttesenSCG-928-L03]